MELTWILFMCDTVSISLQNSEDQNILNSKHFLQAIKLRGYSTDQMLKHSMSSAQQKDGHCCLFPLSSIQITEIQLNVLKFKITKNHVKNLAMCANKRLGYPICHLD